MNQQLDLHVQESAGAPDVSAEEVEAFVRYLDGKDWTFRRQIEEETGWDERTVRALAKAARPRVVSYPGSRGYKLWSRCTVEEIDKLLKVCRAIRVDAYETEILFLRAYHARGATPVLPAPAATPNVPAR